MPAKRSDASRYPSRYAPDTWVTAAQWLAELMCERQANLKKVSLPYRFWKVLPEWERAYRQQLLLANGLIKLYSAAAVGAALRTKEGKRVFSLRAKWLDPVVAVEHRRLEREAAERAATPPSPPPPPDLPKTRPAFVPKKSILTRLRELDGEDQGEEGGEGKG